MDRLVREANGPALLLDSGAMLFKYPTLSSQAIATARLAAEGVIRAHNRMGYSAVGIAPQDLAGGLDPLRQQGPDSLPWISLNLVTDQGQPVFPPWILTRAGSLRVAILGLTGPVPRTNVRQNDYQVRAWQKSLPPVLAQAEKKADLVILLSSYPLRTNEQIARSQKGIALILQAGGGQASMMPRLVGETLICQTASRGKYLGILDIDWRGRGWIMATAARQALLRHQLERITLRIERRQRQTRAGRDLEQDSGYQQLIARRTTIEKELQELAREHERQQNHSTYSNRFVAIKTSLPKDPHVEAIVRQTLARVNELGQRQREEQKKRSHEAALARRRLAMLTGARVCSGCHHRQAAFWRRTGHAAAWQTLVAGQRQFDRNCQPCHVTLPAEALAQAGMEGLPPVIPVELRAVGCEACHGPGRRHADNPARNRLRKPDAATCASCHQPDHDPGFSFANRLPLVRCPGKSTGR